MPTRNRRRFVGQAIRYFLRQNYPRIELVVVDDGEDGIDDLIPGDRGDRVRYVRLERRRSIGAKRNLGCSVGRGELIAHWDDDDWMAPDRLSRQAAELEAAGADVCGVRELLYYWPEAGQAWLYAASESPRPWVAGGTLLYRKSAWEARPFPEVDVGEDAAFVAGFPADRVHAMADASFYVGLIHPANTAAKNLADPRWRRRSLDEVSQLLTPDRDFYASIRGGGTRRPAPAPAPRSGVTPITVAAPLMVYDGYGSMAEFLVLGLERAGASVRVAPLGYDPAGMTAELREIVARPNPSIDGPLLYFCWPRSDLDPLLDVPELYINTMWESSRLPASWPAALNRARALIVPTRFVARVFRDSGINAPIEVIPEGIDPNVYRFEDRPDRPGLTTLIVGTAVGRKHLTEGVAAWHAAFDGDPEARLLIKSRWKYADFADDDARIEFVDSCEPTRGIAHWYRRGDGLLALGSVGFGLPMV